MSSTDLKYAPMKMVDETETPTPLAIKFSYRIRVETPIILTNFSGHITNAVAKRMLMSEDPLRHLIQVSPIFVGREEKYIFTSPTPLPPGQYGFTITTPLKETDKILPLLQQTQIELEGIKCRIEQVEFQPVTLQSLRSNGYPKNFQLIFRTPTIFGKKPLSIMAGEKIYELLPTPVYVFGTLASTWNRLVRDDNLKIDIKKYVERIRSHMIVIPPIKLSTFTVRLGGKRSIPGFIGRAGYTSIRPDSYEHLMTVLLARLSTFTGVGVDRKLGFGVTSYQESMNEGEDGT